MTTDELVSRLHYEPETGLFRWRPCSFENHKARGWNTKHAGKIAGSVLSNGYRYVNIGGRLHLAHRLAWLYVHGRLPENDIDHIDGNRSNNAIANLREATRSQNLCNKGKQSNNKSGHKGVVWIERIKKWRASLTIRGRDKFVGHFDCPLKAAAAYSEAARRLHGEFARTD